MACAWTRRFACTRTLRSCRSRTHSSRAARGRGGGGGRGCCGRRAGGRGARVGA